MPAVQLRITWPDGSGERLFSPSSVVREFFEQGTAYPLGEFVERADRALQVGSDRLRQRRDVGCPVAAEQRGLLQRRAREFAAWSRAEVMVEGFEV